MSAPVYVNDDQQLRRDQPERNPALLAGIFVDAVLFDEYIWVKKDPRRGFETHAMLLSVGLILSPVPLKSHGVIHNV